MKAVQITHYGQDGLELREVDKPRPGPGEVLVKIRAASVNPFDVKMRNGWLAGFYPLDLPATTGGDYAGEVEEIGVGVQGLAVGDKVYGLLTPNQGGSYAEYVTIGSKYVRPMPAGLSFDEAAALPLAGQTALFALETLGGLKAGQRVLIHAAGGGVGGVAVQIAKARGAEVFATCSTSKVEMVKSLGADVVIDYTAEDFRTRVADVDLALDPIGGEVNAHTYEVLKRGGVMLAVLRNDPQEMAHRQEMSDKYGVEVRVIAFENEPDLLDTLRDLVEAGKMRPNVQKTLPLAQAAEAQALIAGGHMGGKIVLQVA